MVGEVSVMKNGYYVDPRYLFDDGCGKDKLDFGQRVNRVINIQSYYAHRNYRPGIPPYTQPQFQHPELYFWVVSKHLRVIGTDLELPMEKDWSPSLQEKVARVLGPAWLREPLYEIYRFLEAQTFSEYYDTLLSFKWTARLLSFPLFDQYERIQLIDGKLFGWLPCSTAKDSEYAWQLLTEKTVDKEIRLCSGINKIGRRQKMHLTKLLVRLHQNDPYAKKSSWEKELTVCYQEGVLEYLPSMAAAAVRFSKEKLTDIPYPLWLGTLSSDLQCSDALERTLSTLTDGNVDKLELLAELFARIFCCTIPSKYLWYIHGNSTAFSQWLYLLTDGKVDHALYPSSQSQAEKYLIYDQSLRFLIQWNSDSLTAEQFAHLNHSWLNRYIEGSGVIKIDDSYQVEQTVAYSPAVFFLSEGNTIDTAKAFKKLPWRKLEIPYTWSTPFLQSFSYMSIKN
ncbi:MAG: hypothetical protein HFF39_00005 [Lawsonibacter sp.]|nr:hypothetical protein [Lawsonibacter sp.]